MPNDSSNNTPKQSGKTSHGAIQNDLVMILTRPTTTGEDATRSFQRNRRVGILDWLLRNLHLVDPRRGAAAAFALAIVWTLAGQYFVDRGSLSEAAQDCPSTPVSQSYRREVERQRYLSSRFLLWSFGPAVLAIGPEYDLLTLVWNHGTWTMDIS